MAELNVSDHIFSREGSKYFKDRMNFKRQAIFTYTLQELLFEKENLVEKRIIMNERLHAGLFSPHQKTTYETYLNDVEDLINAIAILSELESSGGARKRKRRRSYKRKSYKRKSIKRRTRK